MIRTLVAIPIERPKMLMNEIVLLAINERMATLK
jgi:hypothetical protein